MTTVISNLPMDLMEEILSRVRVKSIGAVRSTCKNWNALSKHQNFVNKHIGKAAAASRETEVLMITVNYKHKLSSVNLYDFHNKVFDPSINRKGILLKRENSDSVVLVHRVFYCNGLLLCLWRGNNERRLLVCNPYWGKTRWIKSPTKRNYEVFAFGYDKSCGTHKILRLSKDDNMVIHIDIYDLSSDSWKTPPDAALHSNLIEYTEPGSSLKGNTYWYAYDKQSNDCFLQCFDFTRERFGPRLPQPVNFGYRFNNVSLSSVKEENLALLLKHQYGTKVIVWVTEKIEPDAVSWSRFFKVELLQLNCGFLFGSFLINKEKKTVVLFDDWDICYNTNTYIIDGDLRKVNIVKPSQPRLYSFAGCYVPSSVQI